MRIQDKIQPAQVVAFDPETDNLYPLDLTHANTELTREILKDTTLFSAWVDNKLRKNNARYAVGGYNEHRTIYSRSTHFNAAGEEEPRRLHLGVDIWGPAGTPVYNVLDGEVYGFANNDRFGDYGATIVMKYTIDDFKFYILYGHLNAASLDGLYAGKVFLKGEKLAEFGIPSENGHWPPHLHFQIILEMGENKSDYPGVCRFSEREKYLQNSPDPKYILERGFYPKYW